MSDDDMGPSRPRRRRIIDDSESHETMIMDPEIGVAGKIIRIHMENIMCHANHEIRLHPRINFISGSNGSGKSAVIAALVVGLGETGSVTGRFKSLKDMIKHGENSGRITIELSNNGLFSYKPEVYGSSIIIERSILMSGSSSYKIKSNNGTVVSKTKKELDMICEALHLHVRNPLCVLNQDNARTFLSSVDAKMRYNLFMKATMLEAIWEEFEKTHQRKDEIRTVLMSKHQALAAGDEEQKQARKKLECVLQSRRIQEELMHLQSELFWASVFDEQEAIKSLEEERISLKDKLKQIETDASTHQEKVNELNERREEIKVELDEFLKKKSEFHSRKQEVESHINKIRTLISVEIPTLQLFQSKFNRNESEILRAETFIEEMNERSGEAAAEHNQNVERLRALEEELKVIDEQISVAERDVDSGNFTKDSEREATNAVYRRRDLERDKQSKTAKLLGLKDKGDVKLVLFGNHVPDLLKAIDTHHMKFKHKPVGPLGQYVSFSGEPEWAPAVELVIGDIMTSFCVDNHQDFKTLSALLRSLPGSPNLNIIITPFLPNKHDVTRYLARVKNPGVKSVLDLFHVNNTVAYNAIIDQTTPEGVLLFETDDLAQRYTTHQENVPRNMRLAITKDCDMYYPAPNYKTYFNQKRCRFFQSQDKKTIMATLESEIKKLTEEIKKCLEDEKEARQEHLKMENFMSKRMKELKSLQLRRRGLLQEKSELKDREDTRPVERTRVALEEELETFKNQRAALEEQKEAQAQKINKIREEETKTMLKLRDIESKLGAIQDNVSILEEKIDQTSNAQRSLEFLRTTADKRVRDFTEKLRKNEERMAEQRVEYERALQTAEEETSERIETTRSPMEVTRLISQKEREKQAAQKVTGDPVVLMEAFKKNEETLKIKKREINHLTNHSKFFSESFKKRVRIFSELRDSYAGDISVNFTVTLLTRGYSGNLSFSHDESMLEMEVQPQNDTAVRRKDIKTLSGGEKSYSMVSFILAIWHTMMVPFVVMDEFDVFMDGVNRQIIMKLLMQYAEETPNKQFIFLTPLDTSMVKTGPTCKLFRMADHKVNN